MAWDFDARVEQGKPARSAFAVTHERITADGLAKR